ncbi:MAG: energy transducer TonB, partial [Pseudomonadota bacterium]|nr:energy transducer TonB [Pseudomonadota bacterium]
MSGNKIVAIIIVGLIHVAIGYVLITGLAYSAVKKVVERVTTVDIEEPPPPEPEEEPPPPEPQPDTAPPPPVAPPPPISVATNPPQVRTQQTIPPPAPPALRIPPAAPVAPPAPPPPPPPPPPPANPPRPSNGNWITDSDYRSSWISRDYSGTVSFTLSIGSNGRVSGCSITGGSAPGEL